MPLIPPVIKLGFAYEISVGGKDIVCIEHYYPSSDWLLLASATLFGLATALAALTAFTFTCHV